MVNSAFPVSALSATGEEDVLTYDDLLQPFTDACKPSTSARIGLEVERFGVARNGQPLRYDGPGGILAVLHEFVTRYGWMPKSERPSGPVIAVQRGDSSITLEPAGQLELSGAPMETVHHISNELSQHIRELHTISDTLGIRWLATGFHPTALHDQLGWVPKARYSVMRVYLPTRGALALDMMRRTATVQANFDYESEEDAMRKLRVSLRLSPFVAAMFANGPFAEGKPFGGKSRRILTWLDVDPDRQGLLPTLWESRSFSEYVDWALDVPMFLFMRRGKVIRNTGQTFRSFMNTGFDGHRASMKDWLTHVNSLFPEVRLKKTIEMRAADSVPAPLMCALPAVWTGLLYDEVSLERAEAVANRWDHAALEVARRDIAMRGLGAEVSGQPVARIARELVQLADDGLARRGRLDPFGRDERVHLKPIVELVERGLTPADLVLAQFDPLREDPEHLIALTEA